MNVCPYCGRTHLQSIVFCDACGTLLEAVNSPLEQPPLAGLQELLRTRQESPSDYTTPPRGRSETPRKNERITTVVVVVFLTAAALCAVLYHAVDAGRELTLYSHLTVNASKPPATEAGDLSSQLTTDLQRRGLTVIHPFLRGINDSGHDTYIATATDGKFTYDIVDEFPQNQSETQARYSEAVQSLQKEEYIVGLDSGATWTGYTVGSATMVKNAGADVVVIRATINVNYFIPFPAHLF